MIKPEDVTITIPHLGETDEQEYALNMQLDSLKDWTGYSVIAKNGNTNCSHDVSLWHREQGQCMAVNAAVATTNTEWIFITNDDMIYAPGWFDKLINIERNSILESKIFCISPMLVEPRAGAPTFIVKAFGGAGGDFNKQAWLDFAKEPDTTPLAGNTRTGFNFPVLIKRELWDTIGGYDINYDPWGSNGDSDLEYKIKLAGVQPYQNTNCLVYHFSQTSGTFEPKNDEFRFKNYAYFKEKWGFERTDDGIWEATFEIPNEGRLFRPEWENKYK